jgi:hypothetical protein
MENVSVWIASYASLPRNDGNDEVSEPARNDSGALKDN